MGPTNELLIRAGCLGAGLLIGSQIAAVVVRNKLLKTFERIRREDESRANEYYRKYYEGLYNQDAPIVEAPPAPKQTVYSMPEKAVLDETDLGDADLFQEYTHMEELLDYQGKSLDTPDEEDIPVNPTGDVTKPYRLTFDQFDHAEVGYEKQTVTYYPEDGVIVDEDDEPSPTANKFIGQENLDYLMSDEADWTIYVRNDAARMDFEVNLAEGSYSAPVI